MKKPILAALLFTIAVAGAPAQSTTAWGDQGNGTYVNPILNADYSDPDVIRVGEKYYMVCSDFHYIGMPVLESDDMVNWTIISQVYDRFDYPKWDDNRRFAGGSWAPAIRYHDGKFWVFFCTPHEGLFMTTATDRHGPWERLHRVVAVEKWEDPCPFWDEDGQAYLGRSRHGAGPIILHKMSPDGRELLDDGVTVYTGPVAEGTKIYKRDGYYYISIPEGGVEVGWQTVLRSRNIYGPYEKKVVMEQGSTPVNGPHQGALVDTPDGEWWFFHFQFVQPIGRVVHLQPAHWKDGWPVIGADIDMNGIGEPVGVWTKPRIATAGGDITLPQSSDDFAAPRLGVQWQYNHNPRPECVSLTARKGWLRLTALQADSLKASHNMLSQKTMGYHSEATTRLDLSRMAEGQRAGLLCAGHLFNGIGVLCKQGKKIIYLEKDGRVEEIAPVGGKTIYLRAVIDYPANSHRLYYSTDGKRYVEAGEPYALRFGSWKGSRVGLYTYNVEGDGGVADFDFFTYTTDGPGLAR